MQLKILYPQNHIFNFILAEKVPITVDFLLGFCLSQAKSRHSNIILYNYNNKNIYGVFNKS